MSYDLKVASSSTILPDGEKLFTVSEINRLVKHRIEEAFPAVWITGEISNWKRYASGHVYFTLKDGSAQISGVMWRSTASRLKYKITDGMEVVAYGGLSLYEPRGSYQIIVSRIEPKGIGGLELAFRQLKEKLEKEGLFDPARKKPLPFLPETIGIVTSPSGAAIRDMLSTIYRRFPPAHVRIFPVRVQGEGAATEIAHAIDEMNRQGMADVLIVGRGGGSLEDLWAFNEEVVARAIARSEIPVISAVGHEVDVSISDLVADFRALTPTAAGEKVVPDHAELLDRIAQGRERLRRGLERSLQYARARLKGLEESYGLRMPREIVARYRQQLDEETQRLIGGLLNRARQARSELTALSTRLEDVHPQKLIPRHRERLAELRADLGREVRRRLQKEKDRFLGWSNRLEDLSPLKVLTRGYSVTRRGRDGTILRSVEDVKIGETIRTLLPGGEILSNVEGKENDGKEKR